MKKYLEILTVLIAVILSSCSNDDIPVSYSTVFKVDPSTVISSYIEYNAGDLTSLGSDYQIRIRLLVYDKDGVLVTSGESYSPDYTHIQTFTFNLTEGEYTTVAITDVVGKTSSAISEIYTLSGQERLNTTQITETTKYIAYQRGILGLTVNSQYIDSATSDINIDVEPAGCLIVYHIDDWNSCLDFEDPETGKALDAACFELWANQYSSDLTLNSMGEPTYSTKSSSDYDWRWLSHDRNSKYAGGYGYIFKFPMKKVKLQWVTQTQNGTVYSWGDSAVVDLEAGKEYFFELDVPNDEALWKVFNNSKASQTAIQKYHCNDMIMNPDFGLNPKNGMVSIRAIDYLKAKK